MGTILVCTMPCEIVPLQWTMRYTTSDCKEGYKIVGVTHIVLSTTLDARSSCCRHIGPQAIYHYNVELEKIAMT